MEKKRKNYKPSQVAEGVLDHSVHRQSMEICSVGLGYSIEPKVSNARRESGVAGGSRQEREAAGNELTSVQS